MDYLLPLLGPQLGTAEGGFHLATVGRVRKPPVFQTPAWSWAFQLLCPGPRRTATAGGLLLTALEGQGELAH